MRGGSCRNHPRSFVVGSGVIVDLYTSAFCEPCHLTRAVLADAARLVPDAEIVERDIVASEAQAEVDGIRVTPTVIVRGADGVEVFRAEGVPTVPQVLAAFAKAL
jgi:thiol-disulfide isomerase/thioredoxin